MTRHEQPVSKLDQSLVTSAATIFHSGSKWFAPLKFRFEKHDFLSNRARNRSSMLKRIFAPGSDSFCTSLALFVFRLCIGLTMLLNHGLDKLKKFSTLSSGFPDPLHVGHTTSLVLVVFAEVVCSALLALGLVTRFAAFVSAINMAVAFFVVLKASFGGEHSGEPAFIYLAGFIALLIAGPGKLSMDAALFRGKAPPAKA